MAVVWAQLMLMACLISMSASLSCDDVTCCSGKVCVEETMGLSGGTRVSCVSPTSCDQLDCPSGFVCVSESLGLESAETKASCRASCNNVHCPSFLQCVEKGSTTECVPPSDCSQVVCPFGTVCQNREKEGALSAMCLGESCDLVDCFDGSRCDYTTLYKRKRDSSRSRNDFAVCLPQCEGADICPEGMVCEEGDYKLTCRKPQSCDELECPMGQECQEVTCGRRRSSRSRVSDILVSCVAIPAFDENQPTTEQATATGSSNPADEDDEDELSTEQAATTELPSASDDDDDDEDESATELAATTELPSATDEDDEDATDAPTLGGSVANTESPTLEDTDDDDDD